ncbi:hypothetical protein HUO13_10090 [Saccharopolyspora erythraea]|uniref:hypothetical protein n=1 Tax=Saccharopolyspora erythraea TaxID=1836 RepID=UPI001BA5CDDB|nr:hypothetical protein [Saccharopolyspora erythraea]QUH01119.1 hypothetical protein HUO13_10090 [Saccharopolyspora erythraea]
MADWMWGLVLVGGVLLLLGFTAWQGRDRSGGGGSGGSGASSYWDSGGGGGGGAD